MEPDEPLQGLGASFLAGDDLAGGVEILDRLALGAHLGDAGAGQAHAHVGGELEFDLVVVDRLCHLADQTSGGDDDVATPRRLHHLALLFGAALLRAPKHEIDDGDHGHDRHQLNQRVARPKRGAGAGLCVSRGNQHRRGRSNDAKAARFIEGSSKRRGIYSGGAYESNGPRVGERRVGTAPLASQ